MSETNPEAEQMSRWTFIITLVGVAGFVGAVALFVL